MVKKKLVALGVSVAAVTAVVGAGFSAWTFGEEAKKEQGFGVHVTAAYQFGEVTFDTVNNPDTVVLDQSNASVTPATSGITLVKSTALNTAIADVKATWTVDKASYANYDNKLTYTVNVYVNAALSTYVTCDGAKTVISDESSAYNGYTKYAYTLTNPSVDLTGNTNTVVTMTVSPKFTYVADQEPDTFEKYQAMVAAIGGETSGSKPGQNDVATGTEYTVAATDKPVIIEFVVAKTTA